MRKQKRIIFVFDSRTARKIEGIPKGYRSQVLAAVVDYVLPRLDLRYILDPERVRDPRDAYLRTAEEMKRIFGPPEREKEEREKRREETAGGEETYEYW